jgi:hypothetical protein
MANRAYAIAHWALQATPLHSHITAKHCKQLWQGRFETCPYNAIFPANPPFPPKKHHFSKNASKNHHAPQKY